MKWVIAIFLGFHTWMDLRKREINLWLTGIFGVSGLIYHFSFGLDFMDLLWSIGIGVTFLAVSLLTKGAVGMGDGWILLALGTMLSMWEMLIMLGIALFLASVWALILLVLFKKNKNTEFPFVPFLLLGYIGGSFL